MKTYSKPTLEEIDVEINLFCGSLPNSNWTTDENGNYVNPEGTLLLDIIKERMPQNIELVCGNNII